MPRLDRDCAGQCPQGAPSKSAVPGHSSGEDVWTPCASAESSGFGPRTQLLQHEVQCSSPPGRTALSQAGEAGAMAVAKRGPPHLHSVPSKAVSWLARWEQQATVFALDRAWSVFSACRDRQGVTAGESTAALFHLSWQREDTALQFNFFFFFTKFHISLHKMNTGSALNLS